MTYTAKQIENTRTLVQAAVTEMKLRGFSEDQIVKQLPMFAAEAVKFLAQKVGR